MFHLYLTLAYIIPNFYVYFRIRYLFISKNYRLIYTFIYLSVASIYPITERFSEENLNSVIQFLISNSGYILPFFLYLFLSVLVFDFFLLINKFALLVSPDKMKSYSFRLIMLAAIILLSIAIVVAGIINLNTIRVSKYTVEVSPKNSKIDHLRIVFVADIHLQQNTRIQFIEQFVRKINTIKPDLMLCAGDIVEGDNEDEISMDVVSAFNRITAKYGIFGAPGNHEYYGGNGQNQLLGELGINMLCDTVIRVDSSFYLAGRNDQHIGERKTVIQLLGSISHDLPVILIDHRPTELQDVSHTIADVQFSGHTHNGQMFPVNLITKKVYELNWGYKKIRDTHFFVTSGLRLWGPPVKTAGKSEIMLIDIYFK